MLKTISLDMLVQNDDNKLNPWYIKSTDCTRDELASKSTNFFCPDIVKLINDRIILVLIETHFGIQIVARSKSKPHKIKLNGGFTIFKSNGSSLDFDIIKNSSCLLVLLK